MESMDPVDVKPAATVGVTVTPTFLWFHLGGMVHENPLRTHTGSDCPEHKGWNFVDVVIFHLGLPLGMQNLFLNCWHTSRRQPPSFSPLGIISARENSFIQAFAPSPWNYQFAFISKDLPFLNNYCKQSYIDITFCVWLLLSILYVQIIFSLGSEYDRKHMVCVLLSLAYCIQHKQLPVPSIFLQMPWVHFTLWVNKAPLCIWAMYSLRWTSWLAPFPGYCE